MNYENKIIELFGIEYKNADLSKVLQPKSIIEKIELWWKSKQGFLIFCGNPGVGKTYFCAALCRNLLEKNRHFRYMTEREFFKRMRDTINHGFDYEYEIKKLSEADFFILDDMLSSQMTDFQKECLFYFIDYRYSNRLPTIITTNHFLTDFNSFEILNERVLSRLRDGRNTLIEIKGKDKRLDLKAETTD